MALRNKYWVLRHGRSIPNERGLIVSHLSNGVLPEYGLAPEGILQAQAAGELFFKELENLGMQRVCIFTSPFSRTRETAEAVAGVLKSLLGEQCMNLQIQVMDELRERYFGPPLELQSHEHYPEIWDIDAHNPMVAPDGGESAADVAERLTSVLPRIENDLKGCAVLIVSHGDTLQILQTIVQAGISQ
ncbi:hypothetical protein O6H91_Y445800 [Diphasiastrum complanatum]|nr:hypothetical protein O6H91_Y445800 [Diphasiastrum complanatum]